MAIVNVRSGLSLAVAAAAVHGVAAAGKGSVDEGLYILVLFLVMATLAVIGGIICAIKAWYYDAGTYNVDNQQVVVMVPPPSGGYGNFVQQEFMGAGPQPANGVGSNNMHSGFTVTKGAAGAAPQPSLMPPGAVSAASRRAMLPPMQR